MTNQTLVYDALIVPAEIADTLTIPVEIDNPAPKTKYWPPILSSSETTEQTEEIEKPKISKINGIEAIREILSKDRISPEERILLERAGNSRDDSEISDNGRLNKAERTRLYQILSGADAKERAKRAVNKRISRKLFLAERAKWVTVACEVTGIVMSMHVPAIPGFALVYKNPISELSNARGIAQRGSQYLKNLDTQVLAGLLVVLSANYNLFRWNDPDSGSYKNAVLRTAESEALISSILIIEGCIHSQNYKYLPRLSFQMDTLAETIDIRAKLINWNRLIAKAISEPDFTPLKDNSYPEKPIRPAYQSYWSEHKHSFLKNAETKDVKAQLRKDQKAGKIAIEAFASEHEIPKVSKDMFLSILENLSLTPDDLLVKIISRLEERYAEDANAKILIEIFGRDRKILQVGLAELAAIEAPLGASKKSEDAMEHLESHEEIEEETEEIEAEGPCQSLSATANESDASSVMDSLDYAHNVKIEEKQKKKYTENDAPAALSFVQRVLWAKKMNRAEGISEGSGSKAVQNTSIPSVAVYSRKEERAVGIAYSNFRRSNDNLYIIGSIVRTNHVKYFIIDDFGSLVGPPFFPHTEIGE